MTTQTAGRVRRQWWLRRRWSAMSRRRKWIVGTLLGFASLLLLGIVLVIYAFLTINLPGEISTEQTTQVFFADGKTALGNLQGEENRTDVPLASLPAHVKNAVLAAEDRDYYSHPGVSFTGIARATWHDIFGGGATQGGSTITQQYARTAYLTQRRTFARKFREAVIAIKLDRKYSKNEILELYLNRIYFGRGAYGVEAAAKTYFGIPAAKLSPSEAALLAALIRAPQSGDPAVHPDVAERRWAGVLDAMVDRKWLDASERSRMTFKALKLRQRGAGKGTRGRLAGPKGYLLNEVRKALVANGFSEAAVYTSGLRVTTTIDPKAQAAAEAAVTSVLDDPAKDPQAALVSIQPGTGAIRAMYGGRDYVKKPLNFATEVTRQPGSSFKPYVLAAAVKSGISIKSRYDGHSPQEFRGYTKPVQNFDNEQFGKIDLVEATAHSVNTVYVPLGLDTGIDDVLDTAHDLGIPKDVDLRRDASTFLGSSEVHPIDQAASFATFAAKGVYAAPFLIEKVIDRKGKVLFQAKHKTDRVLDEDEDADVTFALQAVVQRGTARGAQLDGGRPAAGKTGTTQDSRDAWFCGFTPSLAAVVWMGYENPSGQPTKYLTNVHGIPNVTGGTLPAKIWKQFMDASLAGQPVEQFPAPAYVGSTRNGEPPAPTESVTGTPTESMSSTPTPTSSVSVSVSVTPIETLLPTKTRGPKPKPSSTSSPAPSQTSSSTPPPTTAPAPDPTGAAPSPG
jgi:1A family penicillin-binding protein